MTPSESEAALALLRALVDQVKAGAHDPAIVHLVAEKLHHGIDALAKMMIGEAEKK